ncbi:hypothetical protein [Micromonospora sp. AMSO31t]|uniref:hypothetical protein n=1 Tax=Micromonospora sp. AMSO31t TaxID=2650566 RepID=UPI00124B1970|nr:hypothetical protein [Micromonospora sp. AMSO31t]KAB1916004.1 hypothetical protein F8274_01910 [Micromonospora sp. AMSO31t]
MSGKKGDYVPAAAVLLDTRSGIGGYTGARPAGSTASVQALGVGGVPATGVDALLVDVTAISSTGNTHLTVYPDQTTRPTASSLNASVGEVISNSVVVKVGTNGKVAVYNNSGNTHIKLDVQGYFKSSYDGVTGSGFVPVDHTRVVDTRTGLGTTTGTIASGGTRTVTLTGGVVPAGAKAAMVDLIVTGATNGGWATLAPANEPAAASGIDYLVGTTSMGLSVKLPADGKVVINNRGSAVHVAITVQGYFTSGPTTGAGLRPILASRLLDTRANGGTAVPANGTVDVAVGGTNGLPTRGIAGAVLNVTAVSPATGGFLTVWPLGGTQPTPSTDNFTAGQIARSSLVVSKVGTEGKVRIKNNSSGTVHLLVELQAWFADRTDPLPLQAYAPIAVLQGAPAAGAQVGTIEYAYTDNLGRLRVAHQESPDVFSTPQWTVISDIEAMTGRPSLNQLGDHVQVTAQHISSNIWAAEQTGASAPTWKPMVDLGGSMAAPPVAVTLSTGVSVVFGVDADGRLWHYRQTGAGASWVSLGVAGLAGPLTAVQVDNGFRLVATSTTGTVKTAVYASDGGLTPWTDLGGNVTGTPAAIVFPGPYTAIFARAADGSIVTKRQSPAGGWPTSWAAVGTLTNAAGSPAAILDPILGRAAIVVRGTDSEVYRVFETAQGSQVWDNWNLVRDPGDTGTARLAASDPTIAAVKGSQTDWIVVYRNLNDAFQVFTVDSNPPGLAARDRFTAHTVPAPTD